MRQYDLEKENYSAIVAHLFLLQICSEWQILIRFSYSSKRCHFLISSVKKHTLVNFQDQRLFKIEVIKENIIIKMSAEEHQFAIY